MFGAKRKALGRVAAAPAEPGREEEGRFRDAEEMKKEFSPNLALAEDELAEQMKNEVQFSQRVQDIQAGKVPSTQGVLPIRIQIPTTGQLYRFAKTIVSEEPLTLKFSFMSGTTWFFVKILIAVLILLGLLLMSHIGYQEMCFILF